MCLFYSNRAHSVSSGGGARPRGQRRATTGQHNTAPPVPTLSVSCLYHSFKTCLSTRLNTRVLSIQVIRKEEEKNICIYLYIEDKKVAFEVYKKVHVKHDNPPIKTYSILSLNGPDSDVFKINATFITFSRSKPLVTICKHGAASELQASPLKKLLLTTQGPFSFSVMAASSVIIPTFEAEKRKEGREAFVPLSDEAKLSALVSVLI